MNQKMNSLSWTRWKKISTRIAMRIMKVIFNWVLKVIQDFFGFALLCSVIGSENSCHSINQSDAKKNTNLDLVARVFSRFAWLACSYSEFSLALRAFSFRMIGSWNSFVFFFYDNQSKSALLVNKSYDTNDDNDTTFL